jgi:hypothetical protein
VQCSGTMLIESGVIKRIRINSGHYQPGVSNLRALVMALRMWGVPMGRIVFEDYKGIPFGKTGSVQDILDATS